MKVFVAGGTGVIGRRAVADLVRSGHVVSVLTRSEPKAAQVRSAGAAPVAASLFDGAAVRDAVQGHDVVVNLATHIPSLMRASRASAWTENDRIRTEGSKILVDAALAAGAGRYIQESLAFVYDDHGDEWITEDEPVMHTPYTAGAMAAEGQVQRFTDAGGVGVALRFGQFYAFDAGHSQAFVGFARWGRAMMPGEADAYVVTIAADDAGAAVVAALDAPVGVYNVVDDDPVTRREWADALSEAMGVRRLKLAPRPVVSMARRMSPNLVNSQRVSNRRFREATGWVPQYRSFREGARLLVVEPTGRTAASTDGGAS